MMPIIEVEQISKTYRLGDHRQLGDLFARLFSRPAGQGTGGENGNREVRALWSVSFSVMPGEKVGIVGLNGAGKTTLLRILSRITKPTAGRAVVRGRMASLLDVAAGIHSDLTGLENIYFVGSILGMTRKEIRLKKESIAAMAGIERFLDTPVKRYSTGMYLRLGVAIAAHLDADLMMVDEVLAAADERFQERSRELLNDVARGGGAVIFVSHQLDAVESLCERTLMLDGGELVADGPTCEVLAHYRSHMKST